jgi:hypothetical protein
MPTILINKNTESVTIGEVAELLREQLLAAVREGHSQSWPSDNME